MRTRGCGSSVLLGAILLGGCSDRSGGGAGDEGASEASGVTDDVGSTGDAGTSDTDTSTDGTGTSATTATDDGFSCEPFFATLKSPRTQIVWVLARSDSMNGTHMGQSGTPTTRWTAVADGVLATVANTGAQIEHGLVLYPAIGTPQSVSVAWCSSGPGTDLALPGTVTDLANAMPDAMHVGTGGAPLGAAFELAYADLRSGTDARRFAVVVADTAPNCPVAALASVSDPLDQTEISMLLGTLDSGVEGQVSMARVLDEIRTAVVGVDVDAYLDDTSMCVGGSCDFGFDSPLICEGGTCSFPPTVPNGINPRTALRAIGDVGGSVGYQDADTAKDGSIEAALRSALRDSGACTIEVPPGLPTELEDYVHIEADAVVYTEPLPLTVDCVDGDGFWWSVPNSEITLCGALCDAALQGQELSLEAACPPT